MSRFPLLGLAFAVSLAAGMATGGAAQATTLTYDYNLQPGKLHFSLDSTQLTPAGFGTVNPTAGLLSFVLDLAGLHVTAADEDPLLGSTYPIVTLIRFEPSFISFQPATAAGAFDFAAFGNPGGTFSYSLTDPTGATLAAGNAILPEPATMALLSAGLLGLAAVRRRA